MSADMVEGLVAALSGLGVIALASGVYRLRRQTGTSRRVAALFDGPLPATDGKPLRAAPSQSRVRIELRQVVAVLEAQGNRLRGPTMALACVGGLIGVATISPVLIIMAILAALAAYALGGVERRRSRLESQALNALRLLSSGLRAGYSVPQAIALVARESPEPTAAEFTVASQEISIGVHLADAIARLAKRTANPDYNLVAIIVRVQYEVGGNLAQILDSVGETLRERFDLRSQINALTAQQRLSSMILTGLPFGLLIFLYLMDKSFVDPLFTEPTGQILLVVAGVMVFIGWTVMRSMGRIEV